MQSFKTTPVNAKIIIKKTIKRDLIVFPIKKPNGKKEYKHINRCERCDRCDRCNGDKWIVCDECEHEFIYCQKCKCQGIIKCEKCEKCEKRNHCL